MAEMEKHSDNTIREMNQKIDVQFQRAPHQPEAIETMRREKLKLLEQILAVVCPDQVTVGQSGESALRKDRHLCLQNDIPEGNSQDGAPVGGGFAGEAERLACAKLGITLAAQIARTQVSDLKKDGCEIVRPEVTAPQIRAFCVAAYDVLLAEVKAQSSMYIPDLIERDTPDDARRIALLRQYDVRTKQASVRTQAGNKALNRLFGSRG